jgi:G3E family GTPase
MTSAHIPVVLLTGFLGSGKTTLLNRLLAQPDMADTLVVINEYGDASLDHLLVSHTTEQPVVELTGGCVCCTLRGDLAQTLRDAHWRFARRPPPVRTRGDRNHGSG